MIATSVTPPLLAALDQRADDLGQCAQALIASASGHVQRVPSAFPSLLVELAHLRHGDTGASQYASRSTVRLRGFLAVYQGRVRIEAALTPLPERADRAGAWLPVSLRLPAGVSGAPPQMTHGYGPGHG